MSTAAFGIQVWPNGTAKLQLGDYQLSIWESNRIDPEGRTTTDWELFKSGLRVYSGEGPESGVQGFDSMGEAMASLTSFLMAEDERRRYGSRVHDESIFPDATAELLTFIETHAEEASLAGHEWEEAQQ